MAADWVKMRTDLYRDPKVCVIADLLMDKDGDLARYVNQNRQRDMSVTRNVMRNAVVGALVSVWGVARHRGKRIGDDLLIEKATASVVDDMADMPGLGDAMIGVGWASDCKKGFILPNFFKEHNVEPDADANRKNAERQRRHREKSNALRNATVTLQSNDREEKRREENSPIPPPGGDDDFLFDRFWEAYPNSNRRDSAEKTFRRIRPDPETFAAIMAGLEAWKQSAKWAEQQGRFVPNASKFLTEERWKKLPPAIDEHELPRRDVVDGKTPDWIQQSSGPQTLRTTPQ